MKISNFESYIDGVIVDRGLDYYEGNNVESLELEGDTWVGVVMGSDDYTVSVTLVKDEITHSHCDCPYDWGEYCKHQVAVFYAIKNCSKKLKSKQRTKSKENLNGLLSKLDNTTLVSIILDKANQDKQFKDDLLFRFSKKKDINQYVRKMIESAIKGATKGGFVSYADAYDATEGARNALKMAEVMFEDENVYDCVIVCNVILEKMLDLISYCDDSDGSVGFVIEDTIELLGNSTANMTKINCSHREIFDLIFKLGSSEIYDDWRSWSTDILYACIPFCGDSTCRAELESYLTSEMNSKSQSYHDTYTNSEIQKLLFAIVCRYDGKKAADAFIEAHLSNNYFRKLAFEIAVSKKDFDYALKLCLDGEQACKQLLGLLFEWKQKRFEIYEVQGEISGQRELALDLTLAGKFPYFLKLKGLYNEDEWRVILDRIILNFEKKQDVFGIYTEILVHEDLKSKLLIHCKNHISEVVQFSSNLIPEFQNEVEEIFFKYIRKKAQSASNRSHYKNVCQIIKDLKKSCGAIPVAAIKDELEALYIKKPAFVDELKKIK